MGHELKPDGALAPAMVRCPPGNAFESVLSLSRDRGALMRSRTADVARMLGARRFFENFSASLSLGRTRRIDVGSWCTWKRMMLRSISVAATWDDFMMLDRFVDEWCGSVSVLS
jgi:hypothetical protein